MANYTKHFNIPAVIITSIPINVMSMEKAPILRAIHTTFLAGPIRCFLSEQIPLPNQRDIAPLLSFPRYIVAEF